MSAQKYPVARLSRSTSAPRFPAFRFSKKPRPTKHTLQLMNHEEGFLNSRDAQKPSAQEPSPAHRPPSGDGSRRAAPRRNIEIMEEESEILTGYGFRGRGSLPPPVFLRSGLLFRFFMLRPAPEHCNR